MAKVIPYNRETAIEYALQWDMKRNPIYYDYSKIGGDCTNFVSQCLYAGSNILNYTKVFGWYYNSVNDHSPSWTGVQYLYNFLTTNKKKAIFAKEVSIAGVIPGDIIQLGNQYGTYYHTLFITRIGFPLAYENIFISTHNYDAHYRALITYEFANIRFLHIEGVYV